MKENLKIGAGIFGIIFGMFVAVPFLFYSWFGFISWMFTDPYNWIPEPVRAESAPDPDAIACREKGGFAKISGWTGRFKECQLPH